MAYELVYTSVPRGICPGSSGFCIVAYTNGLAANLALRLEGMSAYKTYFPHYDGNANRNPVSFSHYRDRVSGTDVHILSRICFNGLDYTKRSNKLAHHLVLSGSEAAGASVGPAGVFLQPGLFFEEWHGEPQLFPKQREIHVAAEPAGRAERWEEYSGDAGWAGVLAEHFLARPEDPIFVIFDPLRQPDMLTLVREALRLLPEEWRWQVTFNTYLTTLPAGLKCAWRFCTPQSECLREARRLPGALMIDLTAPLVSPSGGELVEFARTGIPPVPAEAEAVTAAEAAETVETLSPLERWKQKQAAKKELGVSNMNFSPELVSEAVPETLMAVPEQPNCQCRKSVRSNRKIRLLWLVAGILLLGGGVAVIFSWLLLQIQPPQGEVSRTESSAQPEPIVLAKPENSVPRDRPMELPENGKTAKPVENPVVKRPNVPVQEKTPVKVDSPRRQEKTEVSVPYLPPAESRENAARPACSLPQIQISPEWEPFCNGTLSEICLEVLRPGEDVTSVIFEDEEGTEAKVNAEKIVEKKMPTIMGIKVLASYRITGDGEILTVKKIVPNKNPNTRIRMFRTSKNREIWLDFVLGKCCLPSNEKHPSFSLNGGMLEVKYVLSDEDEQYLSRMIEKKGKGTLLLALKNSDSNYEISLSRKNKSEPMRGTLRITLNDKESKAWETWNNLKKKRREAIKFQNNSLRDVQVFVAQRISWKKSWSKPSSKKDGIESNDNSKTAKAKDPSSSAEALDSKAEDSRRQECFDSLEKNDKDVLKKFPIGYFNKMKDFVCPGDMKDTESFNEYLTRIDRNLEPAKVHWLEVSRNVTEKLEKYWVELRWKKLDSETSTLLKPIPNLKQIREQNLE